MGVVRSEAEHTQDHLGQVGGGLVAVEVTKTGTDPLALWAAGGPSAAGPPEVVLQIGRPLPRSLGNANTPPDVGSRLPFRQRTAFRVAQRQQHDTFGHRFLTFQHEVEFDFGAECAHDRPSMFATAREAQAEELTSEVYQR
jgi:hypothetical protein